MGQRTWARWLGLGELREHKSYIDVSLPRFGNGDNGIEILFVDLNLAAFVRPEAPRETGCSPKESG